MGLVQKAFSDIITFSRSSNATRIGPTGRVEYAPHNLLQRSQEFDNAYWTKDNLAVSANSATAPDGTVTADMLTENTSTGVHRIYVNLTLNTVQYTSSVYVKANGRSWIYVRTDSSTGLQSWFNISTGVVGTVQSGLTATIQSVGNGWYRCSITLTATSSNNFLIGLANADNSTSYTGDGTSGIYLWGAQLSVGPYPLDYTPTTTAAVYGPRFDYDPVTLAARGLLVEEQRTNLLTYSEQFDNAAWLKLKSSVTANNATSPDGALNADKLVENTDNDNHTIYQSGSTTTTATVSVYAKAAERSNLIIRQYSADNEVVSANFDLSAGTVSKSLNQGTTFTSPSYSITAVGNGWYRCTVTATRSSGTTIPAFDLSNTNNPTFRSGGDCAYAGNGTSGLYLWGAQLEAGSFATSYLPTIASTVTRNADVASVNTLSPWFNATEGTLFAEVAYQSISQAFPLACSLDNTTTSYISISKDTTNSTSFTSLVVDGGVSQASMSTAAIVSANSVVKGATGYKANDFGFSANGNAAVTDVSGTVPTVTRLSIGSQSSFNATNGWLRRIAYYPRKLSSAELSALTA
jgi:hypothetical protein